MMEKDQTEIGPGYSKILVLEVKEIQQREPGEEKRYYLNNLMESKSLFGIVIASLINQDKSELSFFGQKGKREDQKYQGLKTIFFKQLLDN